jgi:hypothetical protein
MALDWNGLLVSLVDTGSESVESRVHRQIAFAGIIGLALIIIWKVLK